MQNSIEKFGGAYASPRAKFIVFVAFLTSVFVMGGGSREDIASLAILRPLSILFLAYGLTLISREQLQSLSTPLYLLSGILAIAVVQLIPLPPSVWSQLPWRGLVVETENMIAMEHGWRPVSISPSRTWSSLFSLTIPLAAMILFAIQDRNRQRQVILIFLVFALLSAIVAILQISGPSGNMFYLYRITNDGGAVGLFANRNHQAVFLACAILMNCWYFSTIRHGDRKASTKTLLAASILIVLIPLIFLTGSRSGLLLGAISLLAGLFFAVQSDLISKLNIFGRSNSFSRWILGGILVSLISVLVIAPILLSRSLALDRLFDSDSVDEMRQQLFPTLIKMAEDFFVFGSGLGSFETIYKMYEPMELLSTKYLNMAHNDWLQWAIETGVLGIAILLIFVWWYTRRGIAIISHRSSWVSPQSLAFLLIPLLGVASFFDYPLRVPSIAMFASIVCAILAIQNGSEPESAAK